MAWGSGLGYGIATASPGFLPQDAFNIVIQLMENPDKDIVLYPEDPLGCTIVGKKVFKTFVDYDANDDKVDNLKFKVRSTYSVNGNMIIIHNTPYEVNPRSVYETIVKLVKENKIEGLQDMEVNLKKGNIPQLCNREDTAEIVIEFKRGYDPHIMMDKLYKLTALESTYPLNCVYVDTNKNVKYNLRESVLKWIGKRRKGLKRMYRLELNSHQKKLSVLEAIIMLFERNMIDKVIKIMKTSKRAECIELLIAQCHINDYQAKEISSMKLSDLSTDSYDDYKKEEVTLTEKSQALKVILSDKKNIDAIIKRQMEEGIKKYSRVRQSKIVELKTNDDDSTEHTICITDNGYIKKLPSNSATFGKLTDDGELISILAEVDSTDKVMLFGSDGKIYGDFVSKLPDSKMDGVGYNMHRATNLAGASAVNASDETTTIVCVTKNGFIKRSKSCDYFAAASSSWGLRLGKDDLLVSVFQSTKKDDKVIIFTKGGKCILYGIDEINTTSRNTSGFNGMKLDPTDEVIGAKLVKSSDSHLITISSKGDLKKFSIETNLGSMKRGDAGIEVLSKNETLYNLATTGSKDIIMTIFTAKTPDGEEIQLADIPVKTRISNGDKLINARRGKELIRVSKAVKKEEE